MYDIAQILHDNGFEYYKNTECVQTLIVKDLEIVHFEPMILNIDVSYRNFTIYINFNDHVPQVTNFGLNFDVDGYQIEDDEDDSYIMKTFINENDFINELHRLNTIGSNIKG